MGEQEKRKSNSFLSSWTHRPVLGVEEVYTGETLRLRHAPRLPLKAHPGVKQQKIVTLKHKTDPSSVTGS